MTLGFNVGAIISLGDMETALDYLHNEEMFRPEIDDYVAEKSVKTQEQNGGTQDSLGAGVIDASELVGTMETREVGGAKHEGTDEVVVADGEPAGNEEGAFGGTEKIPGEATESDESMWFAEDEGEELGESQGVTSPDEEGEPEEKAEQTEEVIDASELFGGIWNRAEQQEEKQAEAEPRPSEPRPAEGKAGFTHPQVVSKPQQVRSTQMNPGQARARPAQPQMVTSGPKPMPQRPVQQRPQARPVQSRPVQARPQSQQQQQRAQQRLVQQRPAPQKPVQAPSKFQEYEGMTATALWNEVRQWIDSQGLAKKLISVAELEDTFGKSSIKRLTSQGYLISLGGGTVAIGR